MSSWNVCDLELHELPTADACVQLNRGRRRVDVQLGAKCIDANLILAQREVMLVLAAVAAHEATVSVLAAGVASQDELAEHAA